MVANFDKVCEHIFVKMEDMDSNLQFLKTNIDAYKEQSEQLESTNDNLKQALSKSQQKLEDFHLETKSQVL
jgi:prefoldin subunit 5